MSAEPKLLTAEAAEAMARELREARWVTEGASAVAADVCYALDAHAAALRAVVSDEVDAQIGRADRVISELCNGTTRWFMSIPARPDDDPDLILSKALGGARVALATLRAQLAAVTKQRDALEQAIDGALMVEHIGTFDCPADPADTYTAARKALNDLVVYALSVESDQLRVDLTTANERIAALAWWLKDSYRTNVVEGSLAGAVIATGANGFVLRGNVLDILDELRALRTQREGSDAA